MEEPARTVCVIWSDFEWGYPSILQSLARVLVAEGHEVAYVGPCRVDDPRPSRYLPPSRYWWQRAASVARTEGIVTFEPVLLKGRSRRIVRRTDTAAVRRGLEATIGRSAADCWVHLVISPGWDTVPTVFADDTVVHYVIDQELHGDGDALSRAADVVWAVSPLLRDHKQRLRDDEVRMVPCFVEDDSVATTIEPPGAADGPPVVGYTGRLSDHRIDLELLETVLSERTDLRFVLRGFVDDPVAESVVARLDRDMGHVSYAGPVELGQVVDSITDYTVSWIPYRDNEFNRSCNPSKMPQILAAGRVAVVPELPWAPLYEGVSASYAAGDPAGASAALDQALEMQAASGSFERCRAAAARLTVSHVLTPRLRELGL